MATGGQSGRETAHYFLEKIYPSQWHHSKIVNNSFGQFFSLPILPAFLVLKYISTTHFKKKEK
jgi:hypothetical protein